MHLNLKGKAALVTGSGKKTGIGYGIARELAACGANVIISDVIKPEVDDNPLIGGDMQVMQKLARELSDQYGVRALAAPIDVTSRDSVSELFESVQSQFSSLDILCNNAGTVFGVPSALHAYDETAWMKTIDVNLHGVFRVSKAMVPLMLEKGGSIVNVASRAAKVAPLFNGAYAVAKAGVVMFTKVMAKELAGNGIRVNAICPGVIQTDFTRWRFELEARILNSSIQERETEMLKTIPLGRLGTIEEVARLVVFLASDASAYMTGQAINVTGGQLMEL